jgi:hypothetical protein
MTNSMILEKCLNFNNVNGFNLVLNKSIIEKEDEEESVFKVIVILIIIVLIVVGGIVFYYNYHVSIVI